MKNKLDKKQTTKFEDVSKTLRPSVLAEEYRKISFVEASKLKNALRSSKPKGIVEKSWHVLFDNLLCSLYQVSE